MLNPIAIPVALFGTAGLFDPLRPLRHDLNALSDPTHKKDKQTAYEIGSIYFPDFENF